MTVETQRRLVAIVMADVVGYSKLMGADETGTLAALVAHRSELIDHLITQHGGRIVKTMGDGLLLEFPSVIDSVKCSMEIQTGMADRNIGIAETNAIRFRIGIHLGDIIAEGDDIFGDDVNVTARIEALADPDGIAVSEDVYRQIRDRIDASWKDGGEYQVKNIARALSVWHWKSANKQTQSIAAAESNLPTKTDRASIAVLPFDNMLGDPEQMYFADGITEDIITELSKISGILVISRNSTFTYKGKAVKAQDVCHDLGVRCILEGSVRKAGERVRITAQLIEGSSGGHLWAERYDRGLDDIFAVQDDVTEKIVGALQVNLVTDLQNRPTRLETGNSEAYDYVLRGRERYRLFSEEGNRSARQLFERAIKLDPNNAAAHAGLAETRLHDWFNGSPEALEEAYQLALKANILDPSLSLVYEALGNVRLFKRQHEASVETARKWAEIEPGNADVYANLAAALHFSGKHEEVFPLIDKAMRLNPFYPFYYILYKGQTYLAMENYVEALDALKRSVSRNPDALPTQLYLASCHSLMGNNQPAREALAEVLRIYPGFTTNWVRTYFPYKKYEDLDRLIKGLYKAGLSE